MREAGHVVFNTEFGWSGLFYQAEPFRIIKVFLPLPNKEDLIRQMGTTDSGARGRHTDAGLVVSLIRDYFKGHCFDIPWPYLDMASFSPLQRDIYRQVAQIPFGQTRSYGQVALDAGRVGAARYVGRCMALNPYPILIPCHRVVRGDGTLGGFGGGPALKQRMLDLEKKGV